MRDDAVVLGDPRSESQLDLLLDEMLGIRAAEGGPATIGAPTSITELRDTARRLRAASQWVALPDSRQTVRRALLAATHQALGPAGTRRAAWRRAGMWLSALAMIAIVGAWSLGAGKFDPVAPASGAAHALRLILDKARVAWFPGPAQYALTYEFPAVRLVDGAGTARIHGTVGGLPVMLSIAVPADTCASGTTCGTFTISPAQLSPVASARFGTMRGTFGCAADGGCTLAFAEMTGVFATISDSALSISATGELAARLRTKMASRGEWVSTVASAGQRLQAGGLLPAGITVKDLATAAGTNGTSHRNNGGGPSGGSKPGVQNRTVQPGTGTGSTTLSGAGFVGRGSSHSAPALQDHVSRSTHGGNDASSKDRGASHSVGGAQPGGDGSRSRDGRGPGPRRDRDQRGGNNGTPHDERGPGGHANGGSHDQHDSSGNGRGAHGDDGSTKGDSLDGDSHQTGAGGDDDRGPAGSGSGDSGRSQTGDAPAHQEDNYSQHAGGGTSGGGHPAAGGSQDRVGGRPARDGGGEAVGDKGAGAGSGGDEAGGGDKGAGAESGGGDKGSGDKDGGGGDRGKGKN